MRAWSYFLYDEQLGNNSVNLKIEAVRYIGQTTDPLNRLGKHKFIRPHLAHCRMILFREHEGPDAILRSLADEFVLFSVKNFFTNLEPDTQAGHKNSPQLNIQARLLAFDRSYGIEVFSELEKILMREKTIKFPRFKCSKCPKEYTTTIELTRHIMEIHKLRKFSCPVPGCSTTTTQPFNLFLHIYRVHSYTEAGARQAANVRKKNWKKNIRKSPY